MAWTSPRTWVSLEVVSAAIMNTHVRDNLLETGPAKATAAGDVLYATAANTLARLAKGTALQTLRMNSGATAPEWGSGGGDSPYKASDETVNNSDTLQNDDDLVFAMAANEVWLFELQFNAQAASGTPNLKSKFVVPSGASGQYMAWGLHQDENTNLYAMSSASLGAIGHHTTIDTTAVLTVNASDVMSTFRFTGIVINGGNAGNFQWQWAQNSATATDLDVKAGAFLKVQRIA